MTASQTNLFFQMSQDILFTCDTTGKILDANPAWQKWLELEPSQIIGQKIADFIASSTMPSTLTQLHLALDGKTHRTEAVFVRENGTTLVTSASLNFDSIAQIFAVACTPIVESSHEQTIAWTLALKSSTAGFYAWDAKTKFMYCSPRYYEILGYENHEFVPSFERWKESLHPAEALTLMEAFMSGKISHYQRKSRHRTKSGEYRWINALGASACDPDGKLTQVSGWIFDIHEDVLAQERLEGSEARSRALLESLPDLTFSIDYEGRYREVHANKLSGLAAEREKLLAGKMSDFLPQDLATRFLKAVQNAIDHDSRTTVEYHLDLPSGRVHFEARVTPCASNEALIIVRDVTDRFLANQALKSSESRMRALLNSLPDHILIFNRDGVYLEVHASDPHTLPAPVSEMVGSHVSRFIPPTFAERRLKSIEDAIDHGKSTTFDGSYELRGELQHFETRIAPGPDNTAIVIARNITEKLNNEKARRESDERFRNYSKNAPGIIFQYHTLSDGRSTFPFANEKTFEILGVTPEELRSRGYNPKLPPYIHPEDMPEVLRIFKAAYESKTEAHWSGRVIVASGETKWLRVVATPRSESDGSVIWDGVALDLTLEHDLMQKQKHMISLLEASSDFVLLEAPPGKVLHANKAMRDLLGDRDVRSLSNEVPGRLYPEQALRRLQKEALRVATQDRTWRGECVIIGQDGTEIPTSQVLLVCHSDQGEPELVATVIRDISDIKATERRVREQQAVMSASSRLAALGEMAGGIAHEINNPLTVAHAYASRLRDFAHAGKITPDIVDESAEKIESVCMRISRIIAGLRTLARDGTDDHFVTADVASIVGDAISLCSEKLRHLQIQLSVGEIPSDLMIECRPVQISQVLLNLLSNAQHAVESQKDRRLISLSVVENENTVDIRVVDSGPGVAPAIRTRIFDPFFTTKEVGRGTGLGLSVSASILRSHSGSLFLNEGEKATTFVVRIPKRQPLRQIEATAQI